MRNPLRIAGRSVVATLFVLAAATCTEQPTEPGGVHSGQVRFTPVFPANTFTAGLPIDNITVTVVRPPAETLVVRNVTFALTDSVLNLSVPVILNAPSESLQVTIDLQSGASILFHGSDTLLVSAGDMGTAAPPIALTYVGPGANIAYLSISPFDTLLTFGDTLFYGATASDASEAPVASFYLHWYTTPAGTAISPAGRIIAPNVRGKIEVHAWTPSGVEDSTALTFVPRPNQLVKISGDLQSDTASDTLTVPFVVEARAADNLPVAGVHVTFAAVTAGGSVLTTSAVTDSLGRASTTGVLGDTARTYNYTATIAGVAPATFQATANAGPPVSIAKVSGDAQSDTAGKPLPLPFVVRVADAGNNPVAGAMVIWTRTAGSGTPALDTLFTDGAGHAQLSYTLGAQGSDTIRAQLGGTGAFVDFTATAAVGAVNVVLVSGDAQTDTVTRLLAQSLVVQAQTVGTNAPIAGIKVFFAVTTGTGALSADSVVTDTAGKAAVTLTFTTLAGPVAVQVDAKRGGALATFHLSALAKAPHHLVFTVPEADTQRAGVLFLPQPVVQVRDTFENAVHLAGIAVHAITNTSYLGVRGPTLSPGGIKFTSAVSGPDSAVTDTSGTASFSGLFLLGSIGPEVLRFSANAYPGAATLLDSLYLKAGLPKSVIAYLGTGQTAFVDSLVTTPPKALVVDTSGNGVSGVQVVFVVTAGGGTLTGDTVLTDANGYATVGSWRMGATFGTDSLEARVAGLTPAVFTATALPPTPAISLSLVGTSVVGVGRSAPLAVRLSSPAPVGGVVVSFASDNPSVVSVDSAAVSFNQSDTLRYITLTGVTVGTAHILASGPGYTPDTLLVTGSLNLISLPTTLNVPYGNNASIAVTLGQPAPAGGVVVTLISSDSTKVGIVTPTVTIPQGQTSANGTVHGTALGTAMVAATNPNYAPDVSTVSTTATLNIVNGSQTIYSTIPVTQTLEFRSNGALIAAPAGGVIAALTATDPTCVAVPATDTIPAGLSSTTFTPSYGGSAALPCNTYVVASYPGVNPDSIYIAVNPPPTITLYGSDVGSGLATSATGYLQVGVPSTRTAVIRSLDTTKVLVATTDTAIGGDTAAFVLTPGGYYASYYIRGKEGIVNDSALVQMDVPGFVSSQVWIRVRQAGIQLSSYTTSTTTLSAPTSVTALIGLPAVGNTYLQAGQAVRPGGTTVNATFTVTPSAGATFTDSLGVLDTVKTLPIKPGQYITVNGPAAGGIAYVPLTADTTTLTVSAPGLVPMPSATAQTIISAPTLTLYGSDVGSGLATSSTGYLQTGVPSGRTAVIHSLDTTKVLVATTDTAVGSDSAAFPLTTGGYYASYYIRGKEGIVNDSALVQMDVPGYVSSQVWIRVRQPGVQLSSYTTSTTTLSAPTNVTALIGLPAVGNSYLQAGQVIRPGGATVPVTFTVTPSAYATLTDTNGVLDTVKTLPIKAGQYLTVNGPAAGGIAYVPLGAGSTTLSATIPGYVSMPTATATTAITAPTTTLYGSDVGSGLATSATGYLQTGVPSARTVVIKSLDSTKVLVATADTAVGSDSAAFPLTTGGYYASYYIRGKEGIINDSALVQLTVPGYTSSQVWIHVRQAGIQLVSAPSGATTSADSLPFYSLIGLPSVGNTYLQAGQVIRPGGTIAAPLFKITTPAVGRLVTTSGQQDSMVGSIAIGAYYSASSVSTGGQAFKALTTGVDTILVTAPGYVSLPTAVQQVTVSTPGITFYPPGVVGAGLEASGSFYLGASRHGGVNVVVKSSNPSVALLALSDTSVGTDSVVIFVPDGQTYGGFWVQGVDSAVGTPILTVSANGFLDNTSGVTVGAPGIVLNNVPSSMQSTAADQAVYAYVGVPYAGNTGLSNVQERRPGPPLVVTLDMSNPAAATLADGAGPGTPKTATIVTGHYYTPFNVASGGVAIHPVAPGVTTVLMSLPGFAVQSNSNLSVTVTP